MADGQYMYSVLAGQRRAGLLPAALSFGLLLLVMHSQPVDFRAALLFLEVSMVAV